MERENSLMIPLNTTNARVSRSRPGLLVVICSDIFRFPRFNLFHASRHGKKQKKSVDSFPDPQKCPQNYMILDFLFCLGVFIVNSVDISTLLWVFFI